MNAVKEAVGAKVFFLGGGVKIPLKKPVQIAAMVFSLKVVFTDG